ncbi:unnamed protein product [Coffea canephora]|uniref:Uncharacterized protein n=1 Tax=Coffea canephora TaxID=49390 RepID=A0A068U408_COFCA|nr:unnamed protein product [Coffea canephora]
MASVRFAGLIIGFIIVSLALKYSTACAHEGSRRKGKWAAAGIAPQGHAPSKNDLSEETSAAEVVNIAGRKGLRGSEMQVDKLSNTERENKLGYDKRKISGNHASMDSEEAAQNYHLMKAQVNSKMSKQPRQKSGASSSHEDASKAFLEAADEVVNLMRKDYGVKDHPRHRPPINNHEPTD